MISSKQKSIQGSPMACVRQEVRLNDHNGPLGFIIRQAGFCTLGTCTCPWDPSYDHAACFNLCDHKSCPLLMYKFTSIRSHAGNSLQISQGGGRRASGPAWGVGGSRGLLVVSEGADRSIGELVHTGVEWSERGKNSLARVEGKRKSPTPKLGKVAWLFKLWGSAPNVDSFS